MAPIKNSVAVASAEVSPRASAVASAEPLSRSDRWALVATLAGAALATLDTAIANTALPAIAADLHATPAASVWVINAYQVAVVAVLLPFAALGDLLGPRRIYLFGLLLFTAASLACALAPTLPLLAAARAVQGIGGAAVMSVNIALIRMIYPAARLGRGVGLNAMVVGVGFVIGPSIASLVLSIAAWPWLFAINVPVGLVALAAAFAALPRSIRRSEGLDRWTALLTACAFAALMMALCAAAQRASWHAVMLGLLVAAGLGVLLLRRQAGHASPMLPVDLMRRPMFALSALTALASFTAQGLAFVSLPFYFEQVLHRSPVDTGFLMTPWPIVVALAAPFAGRLSDRYRPAVLGGLGLTLLSLGMASLALLPARPSVPDIVLRMAVCGVGFGLFQSPNLRALMSSAPIERSGGASGVIAMVRLIGQTGGAALVALCFGLLGTGGATWALALGAVFAMAAALTSSARLWAR